MDYFCFSRLTTGLHVLVVLDFFFICLVCHWSTSFFSEICIFSYFRLKNICAKKKYYFGFHFINYLLYLFIFFFFNKVIISGYFWNNFKECLKNININCIFYQNRTQIFKYLVKYLRIVQPRYNIFSNEDK